MKKIIAFCAMLSLVLFVSSVGFAEQSATPQPVDASKIAKTEKAIFALGCFWCAQSDFDKVPGVVKTIVGYDGGTYPNPSYKLVSSGQTNYAEAIEVEFDPNIISYNQLLEVFWKNTDPTVKDKQFCDVGHQYRSAILYLNPEQQKAALASLEKVKQEFPQVYTVVSPATKFYPAEEYHQEYYKKNPVRYKFYRWNCARDKRLEQVWGDNNNG